MSLSTQNDPIEKRKSNALMNRVSRTFHLLLKLSACAVAGNSGQSRASPKTLCPETGLLQRGKLVDRRACVKSRYDGRGLECIKMGKRSKGRQGTGVEVIRDGREWLRKVKGADKERKEAWVGWGGVLHNSRVARGTRGEGLRCVLEIEVAF